MTKTCPCCGQSLERIRYGVKFSRTECRILDLVKIQPGITGNELRLQIASGHVTYNWASIYANRINTKLYNTRYRLVGRTTYGYRIIERGRK